MTNLTTRPGLEIDPPSEPDLPQLLRPSAWSLSRLGKRFCVLAGEVNEAFHALSKGEVARSMLDLR
jgi:hypothetical protein